MSKELEYKLLLPGGAALLQIMRDPWVNGLLESGFSVIAMSSVYYDTTENELARRRWAFRVRSENGLAVAAVKTVGSDAQTRGEWQCGECEPARAIVKLVELGAPRALLSMSGWQPLCTMEFSRTRGILSSGDLRAELALDDGFLAARGKRRPICEAELELLSGSRAQLDALACAFRDRFGLAFAGQSKLERALALTEVNV